MEPYDDRKNETFQCSKANNFDDNKPKKKKRKQMAKVEKKKIKTKNEVVGECVIQLCK